jgi:dipeptidase E
MVMTPRIGEDFVQWKPPTAGDETLGVVDPSSRPTGTTSGTWRASSSTATT